VAANGASGRLLRFEKWSTSAQDTSVRGTTESPTTMDNFHSRFMSHAPYQSNSRTGDGFTNRWYLQANNEDFFLLRYSAAICPTVSGTYEFK
jgi:hypothetical protein